MTRTINSSIITALESGSFKPFYAVDLSFYNGATNTAAPLYLWTGIGDLSANSNTYTGVGDLLSVSGIEEAAELKATGMTMICLQRLCRMNIQGVMPRFISALMATPT